MISLQLVMHKFATVTSFWQVMKFFDSIVKLFISGYLSKISVKRWGWCGHFFESQETHEMFRGFFGTWNNMNRRYWNIPLNKGRSFEAGDLFDLKVLDLPENMANRTITAEGTVNEPMFITIRQWPFESQVFYVCLGSSQLEHLRIYAHLDGRAMWDDVKWLVFKAPNWKASFFSPDIDVSNKRAVEAFLPVFPQIFPSADRFSDEKAWFLQELLEWYVFSDCGDGTDLRLAGLSRVYVDVSLGQQCLSSWRLSGFSTRMPNEKQHHYRYIKLAKILSEDMDPWMEESKYNKQHGEIEQN